MSDLLNACKMAYRKHVIQDDSIGWSELGDILLDAICNEIGDDNYLKWVKEVKKEQSERYVNNGRLVNFKK